MARIVRAFTARMSPGIGRAHLYIRVPADAEPERGAYKTLCGQRIPWFQVANRRDVDEPPDDMCRTCLKRGRRTMPS